MLYSPVKWLPWTLSRSNPPLLTIRQQLLIPECYLPESLERGCTSEHLYPLGDGRVGFLVHHHRAPPVVEERRADYVLPWLVQ